jgi:hypothetical protein
VLTKNHILFSIAFSLTFFTLTYTAPSLALAQDEVERTLLPGEKHEYRFDYKGDRTEIIVVVAAPEGVELLIYSPEQQEPVGSGSRQGSESVWAGRSRAPGAYRATVENQTPGPIVYSMAFLGESISSVGMIVPEPAQPAAGVASEGGRITLNVNLPTGPRHARSPVIPADCTPPAALPPVVNSSVKLCPNEIYPPLRMVGNGIGLFDDTHSAVINSAGRQYALVMEGTGNWIDGVTVQSAPDSADAGAFLCQYEECVFPTQPNPTTLRGGLEYGGGILLLGANNVVHDVTVRGGTIGIATVDGYNNLFVENNLSDLNGWGSYNIRSNNTTFFGNRFDRNNHGCTTPDGHKFEHGCETAGWVCLQCNHNLIANNHCEYSGNCYYLSGERGLASNNNRFVGNYCAASPNNCFEFTFSQGNTLENNVTTAHPRSGVACKYPFWIGGSTVYFGENTWGCLIAPETSIADAVRSTNVPTVPLALAGAQVPFVTNAPPPPTPVVARTPTQSLSQPTPTPLPALPTCERAYRIDVLFDWSNARDWLDCLLRTPE